MVMVRSTEEVQSGETSYRETSLQKRDEFQSLVFEASPKPGPVHAKANVTGYTKTPGVQQELELEGWRSSWAAA